MRTVARITLAATAAACTTAVLTGPALAASTVTTLPFTAPADVVATAGRVFVSGGRTATQIAVTDAAGVVTGSLDNLPGPTDLQLSLDRRTLFAALPSANAIVAFDTGTLRETARYTTGPCPETLAVTGRHLWFGYGCGQWDSDLGRVDLRGSAGTVTLELAGQKFFTPPLLATARANPGILLVSDYGLSPARLWAYTVSTGGVLGPAGPGSYDPARGDVFDLALAPGGRTAYAAGAYRVQRYAVTDLTQQTGAYETGPFLQAMELTDSGTLLATAVEGAEVGRHLLVYRAGGTLLSDTTLAGSTGAIVAGALTWSPDTRRLYTVTYDATEPADRAELHVVTR
ncbi:MULTISPECIES: hypothetical protein [Actinoplanes]|uniref:YncE family protein n=1 Tax=Actinoplanes TaxID=1865 RepID=UPI0005F2E3A9|nr:MULTISPECIES: hypothetical protein [Actinoplanes]GLY07891.1 hypothetical protein Acsp01_82700 [Actinoplanes sp. NBRC 101535]